jgi:endonuclease/exonuclease/phosphatase (EEP) superfamily protein YafD
MVSLAKLLLNVATGGAAIATILGFAGSQWWLFELIEHLRPQYCLILVAAIVVGGISRQAWCFVWCLPLVLNLALIVPLFFTSGQNSFLEQANPSPSTTLRILHANLDHDNQDTTKAIQYLEAQDVDLVLLQEVTSKWLMALESKVSRYRVVKSLPLENSHGIAMLVPVKPSKSIDVVATQIVNLPSYSNRPLLEIIMRWGSREVAILSLSVARPNQSNFQAVEFDAAAKWSLRQQQENKREVVVIGDFNSTPWSGRFRKFLHDANLRNSQRGFGLQPTWSASLPSVLMIAIDHCLHSQSITTISRATGVNIGSDHLPLFVELHLYSSSQDG